MSQRCSATDCAIPEIAEESPEMSTTVWWMMWTGLIQYMMPGFLSNIFAILLTNAMETEFSTLCSLFAVGVLFCEVRRFSLLYERVLKVYARWLRGGQWGCNAEQGQNTTDISALSLSVTDAQAYDTRVFMAAAILGGSSTWTARLASYAVLPLDDSNERWRLALLWSAITWIAVGVFFRGGLGPETADRTGLVCVIVTAGTCLGPLQRLLMAFTPVSERGDLAWCVGLAVLHAGCIVYSGQHSNGAIGLMCSLFVWLCLVATLATLPPPNPEKVAGRAKDETKRKHAIEALCKKTEEVAIDLSSKGFRPMELVQEYLSIEGTRNDVVMRVLSNQISNADRKTLRAGGALAPSSTATPGNTIVPGHTAAPTSTAGRSSTSASASAPSRTNVTLPHIRRSKGVREVYFVGGDKVSIGELLLKTKDPKIDGRIFVVANVQRPTVIGVTQPEARKVLIVGKSDIERNTPGTAALTQKKQNIYVDIDEVEAMSSYRRDKLQIVKTNDRESWGPIRSGWSVTIELYLLVTASVLVVGWYVVRCRDGLQPIRAPMFLVAAIFSASMGLLQPADYQAAPRLLDRWTYCLRDRGMHLSARNNPARAHLVWIFMTLGFLICCWRASKDKNEDVLEVLHEMRREVFSPVGATEDVEKAGGGQRLLRGVKKGAGEEVDRVYVGDWVIVWCWLGTYWLVWLVDAVCSHRAGPNGRLVKSFSRGTP